MKAAIFVPVLLALFLAVKAASGKKQNLTYWKLFTGFQELSTCSVSL